MVSTSDETVPIRETAPAPGQEKPSFGHNPATVSSLSSLDTAGYEHTDGNNAIEQATTMQQSSDPHPLPPITSNATSFATTAMPKSEYTFTTAASTEATEEQQQPPPLPSLPPPSVALMGRTTMQLSPTTGVVVPAAPTANTVPEFLYQLTKMLTDNNRDIIEWSNGKCVASPYTILFASLAL